MNTKLRGYLFFVITLMPLWAQAEAVRDENSSVNNLIESLDSSLDMPQTITIKYLPRHVTSKRSKSKKVFDRSWHYAVSKRCLGRCDMVVDDLFLKLKSGYLKERECEPTYGFKIEIRRYGNADFNIYLTSDGHCFYLENEGKSYFVKNSLKFSIESLWKDIRGELLLSN